MAEKPLLTMNMNPKTFREYYYLKEELVAFCRSVGLTVSGNKQDLAERIAYFLETGNKLLVAKVPRNRFIPECITLESRIESDIICSEKHRAFFQEIIGPAFSFQVSFQKWLKTHAGSTYAEAIAAWYELQKQKPAEIAKQFEYNTYIRDFFKDNPGKSLKEAICCWNTRKKLPGVHGYNREDLQTLVEEG